MFHFAWIGDKEDTRLLFDRCSSCFHLSLHQCGFTKVWQQLPFGLLDICPKVCFYVKHLRFLFILFNFCFSWLRSSCEKDEIILMKTEVYIWMPRFKAWTFASSSLRQSSSRIPTLPSKMQSSLGNLNLNASECPSEKLPPAETESYSAPQEDASARPGRWRLWSREL